MAAAPSPLRLCILALATEWLCFGPCHFLFREATEKQIPDEIPFKTAIAASTGAVEVILGILILIPRIGGWPVRRWAARGSLVLLFLYLPAVYHILVAADAVGGPVVWRVFFRIILVPNNVILALCALYLLRHETTPP